MATYITEKVNTFLITLIQDLKDANMHLDYINQTTKCLTGYAETMEQTISSITNIESFHTFHTEVKSASKSYFVDSMKGLKSYIEFKSLKILREFDKLFKEIEAAAETIYSSSPSPSPSQSPILREFDKLFKEMDAAAETTNSSSPSPTPSPSPKRSTAIPAIGIDLGTTNCCVGVYLDNQVIIVPNQKYTGQPTTPSYVQINDDESTTVGYAAKAMAYKNIGSTVFDIKRLIGRQFEEHVVQEDIKLWSFNVLDKEGTPIVDIQGNHYHPEEISAFLLVEMCEVVENYLGLPPHTIQEAVITVPAYFTDGQRQATIDAGGIAGLKVLTILNEPTAAAISYLYKRHDKTKKKVLIYDLGGGTFDVAILDVTDKNIEVLGVDGDTHLGGVDFDKNLMDYCVAQFKAETGIDLLLSKDSDVPHEQQQIRRALSRLQGKCEENKKYLVNTASVEIALDNFVGDHDLCVNVTRDKFNEINGQLFQRTIEIIDRVLLSVKVEKEEIDDIVLIGGSSRILKIQELLKNYFNCATLNAGINPDEAVAYGAAVQAAIMTGVTNDTISINKIQDVTSRSLGIRTRNGNMSIIIPKNTGMPTQQKKTYTNSDDNQTETIIDIFEGEDPLARNNVRLGNFILSGIPLAPRGTEYIEVTMVLNSMGILHVEAESKTSKNANSITVQENKGRLGADEIIGLNNKVIPKPMPRKKKTN